MGFASLPAGYFEFFLNEMKKTTIFEKEYLVEIRRQDAYFPIQGDVFWMSLVAAGTFDLLGGINCFSKSGIGCSCD